ncbi:MAG TPA: hypothetical protein VHA13_00925 [Gammaproteobacteria bacterium]|nr:hypothetical protein [Gammaproteobacteria bacterium]
MVDLKESAFHAYQVFRELANHEMHLATSLQSLAPTNKSSSSKSAQYLHEDALMLKELSDQLKEMMAVHPTFK